MRRVFRARSLPADYAPTADLLLEHNPPYNRVTGTPPTVTLRSGPAATWAKFMHQDQREGNRVAVVTHMGEKHSAKRCPCCSMAAFKWEEKVLSAGGEVSRAALLAESTYSDRAVFPGGGV